MKLLNSPCIYISAKKKHTQTGFVVFHKSMCKDILEGLSNTINMGRTHCRKYSSFLLFVWEFKPNNVWRKRDEPGNLYILFQQMQRQQQLPELKAHVHSTWSQHLALHLPAQTGSTHHRVHGGGGTQNDVLSAMASELPITELKQGSQSQVSLKTTMCRASRYHQ